MTGKPATRKTSNERHFNKAIARLAESVSRLAEPARKRPPAWEKCFRQFCALANKPLDHVDSAEAYALCQGALGVICAYWRGTEAPHADAAIEFAARDPLCELTIESLDAAQDHVKELTAAAARVADELKPVKDASPSAPLLAFLEPLIAALNSAQRRELGIYFTPTEVVEYLIERTAGVLRDEFGLPLGMADPSIRIIDPAVGSGAFPLAVVRRARQDWEESSGASSAANGHNISLWSDHVSNVLLPNLTGFEILPAAYVVANFLLAMELCGNGYAPRAGDRLRLRLGDALAEPPDLSPNEASDRQPIPVVVGNPPYRGLSTNSHDWISQLLRGQAPGGQTCASYFHIDGVPLGERKTWLHDDYVKFFRLAQWQVEQRGAGVVAFVTNHGFLDNPTFRGMRAALGETFDNIEIIDLHGNSKGSLHERDESVFATAQGMALTVAWRTQRSTRLTELRRGDLHGSKRSKLARLKNAPRRPIELCRITRAPPHHLFDSIREKANPEYEAGFRLCDIMPVHTTAPVTARDWFLIDFDRERLIERLREFADLSISDDEIRRRYFQRGRSSRYPPGDTRGWKLHDARRRLASEPDWHRHLRRCWYRPFDRRWIFWAPWMVDWPRQNVMRHFDRDNVALVCRRQSPRGQACNFFGIVDDIVLDGYIRSDNRGSEAVFPLYLHEGETVGVNVDAKFIDICKSIWSVHKLSPGDLLHFIYALFHSATYRARHAAELAVDFPRVLIPRRYELFQQLSTYGSRLAAAHLQTDQVTGESTVTYHGDESPVVGAGYPKYLADRVYLHPQAWFAPIEAAAWDYRMGAHQVLRKWLKDRRGQPLNNERISEYAACAEAIVATNVLVKQIDASIDADGGWPDAFHSGRPLRQI